MAPSQKYTISLDFLFVKHNNQKIFEKNFEMTKQKIRAKNLFYGHTVWPFLFSLFETFFYLFFLFSNLKNLPIGL